MSARSGDGGAEFSRAHARGGIGIQIGVAAQGFGYTVVRIVKHGGQGREEFGGESGPLKLRQLPGLLLEFLNDRQAWKRWPEESGINYGGNPGQKAGEGQWCAVARDPAGGAGSRVRAGGCGLPELDLEGEVRVEEVGADEARSESIAAATTARRGGGG